MQAFKSGSPLRVAGQRIFRSVWAKMAISAVIVLPVVFGLADHLSSLDNAALAQALASIPTSSILGAVVLTAISFFAMAHYDDMALRALGHHIPKGQALQGGFVATSLSQTLGFGAVVGSIARWRWYRKIGISAPQAAGVSAVVIAGFIFGYIAILSITTMIAPTGAMALSGASNWQIRLLSGAGLILSAAGFGIALLGRTFMVHGFRVSLPPWRMLRANIVLAAGDVLPAAAALWILIPAQVAPDFLVLLPVFLLALGLGLVSNTPGGLGVLELTCLMALPITPTEPLLAALIVFRGLYYGVPALIGAAMLVARDFPVAKTRILPRPDRSRYRAAPDNDIARILSSASSAEASLALLGDKEFLVSPCGNAFVMFAQAGNSLVAMGDPIGPCDAWPALVQDFRREAARRFVAPVFYKAGSAQDYLATLGQTSARIGAEAEVALSGFTTQGSALRELRRKLRAGEKAGVQIHHLTPSPTNFQRLKPISDYWLGDKPGEAMFSMGAFTRDYVARFDVLVASVNGKDVGFVTLWKSGDGREYSIDIMRLTQDAPDGTMHALCHAGIELACAQNAETFSLCAVPMAGLDTPENLVETGLAWVFEKKPHWHGAKGLYRFKNAFRPDWQPRNVVAPSLFDVTLGIMDARQLIAGMPAPGAQSELVPDPEAELQTV